MLEGAIDRVVWVCAALAVLASCSTPERTVVRDGVQACFGPTAQQIGKDCLNPEQCLGTYWALSCDVWTF